MGESKMLNSKSLLLAAGAVGMMALATPANAGFYDGKDVTVIVNAGAGGGLTRTGRLFTTHMKKHLGKGTNMVIKNIAGAGGVKGMNFMAEKAKPNGLTVLWGTSQQMAQLLKLPGVRFDLSKVAVIGAGGSSYLSLARSNFKPGIAKASDLLKVKKMIVGGRGTSDGLGIYARLPLDILGVDYRYVPGYRGQPKLNAAIRANEIGLLTTGGIGYIVFYKDTILKSGEGQALYYHSSLNADGTYEDPGIYPKDVKHFTEFYKETHGGKLPKGPLWEAYQWFSKFNSRPFGIYARKDNSPAHIAELRAAFKKTLSDPEFIAAWTKTVKSAPKFGVGEEVSWLLTDFDKVSPGALAGMKKLTARKKKKGAKKK
jgi:tripartite-type tricarboxylate transporter receptor subunit TctC